MRARSSPIRPLLAATPLTYQSAVSTRAASQHARHITNGGGGERLNKIVYADGVMRAERGGGRGVIICVLLASLAVTNGLNPSSASVRQNFSGRQATSWAGRFVHAFISGESKSSLRRDSVLCQGG